MLEQIQSHTTATARHFVTIVFERLRDCGRFLASRVTVTRKRNALTVRETVSLGDRRFVCVVEFECRRYLIGSSPSSVTLLSQLPDQFAASAPHVRFCRQGGEGE